MDAQGNGDATHGIQALEEGAECMKSLISMPQGPITRSGSKKLQQALITHLQGLVHTASECLQGIPSFGPKVVQIQYNVFQVHLCDND